MDNKKFEKLIEYIINEDEEQARALFHDIVVEKSREIYENIIAEEMEEEGMHGQVGDLMDEISAEESGVMEEDDEEEFDISDDDGEETMDFDSDEVGDAGSEDVEDRVDALEDKLDQLMAEFEELMADEENEPEHHDGIDDPDFGGEEGGEEDFGGEEGDEEAMMESDDEEEEMEEDVMEAITLKKVSVTHGDNGQNTKSPSLNQPKVKAAGVNPVNFAGKDESVPTSPKGPSNAYSKGETQVKHAGQWKNAPAQAGQNLEKAPAPKKGDDGQNTKSPLGESKKTTKRIVK
jgi:hypothetical protein